MNKASADHKIPGLILTGSLFLICLFFYWQLLRLNILPAPLFAALAAVLFLFVILIFLLSRSTARGVRFGLAVFLSLVIAAFCLTGSYVSIRFTDTIQSMLHRDSTETVIMKVFVRESDSAVSLDDLKGESIGILSQIDRAATDEMLKELETEFGSPVSTVEYNSPIQLLRALSEGHVRAILMNEHYLTLLGEEPHALSLVRALHSQSVVIRVTTPAAETGANQQSGASSPSGSADPSGTLPSGEENQPGGSGLAEDALLAASGSCFTVYLSGIDSRQGLVSRSRSDVNIIAVVNPDTRQIALISTPRDCAVLTPVSGDQPDTLTYTGNYGIDVSRRSLEMLYNMTIDYWFRVDFSGFVRIIDVLGGVDINSDVSFSGGGYYFQKGVNHVNGEAALAFARERKAFGGSDQFRGLHQMEVIKATLRKAASSQILSSWNELLSAVSDCFEMTVPYDLISGLVRRQLMLSGGWNIVSYNLEGSYDIREIFSLYEPNYMFLPGEDSLHTARELIRTVLNGGTAAEP
ncbi:MAG: LCP family protein [Lachnospiraceae bacterium]|nr:LCP family protein [Lachnospiraceae bacterium]